MKGKIQTNGSIVLETNEEHWSLLSRGLVNELQITGLVEIEPERQVRIRIKITEAYSPEQTMSRGVCVTEGSFDAATSGGISRINEHLINYLNSKKWIMIGETQGEKSTPVIIIHYCLINLSFYAHKVEEESNQNFFTKIGVTTRNMN